MPGHAPEHSADQAINDIVTSLEHTYRLGLHTRDSSWSPSTRQRKSPADACYAQIKFLYWKAGPDIVHARIDRFKKTVDRRFTAAKKLELLNNLLEVEVQSVRSTPKKGAPPPVPDDYPSTGGFWVHSSSLLERLLASGEGKPMEEGTTTNEAQYEDDYLDPPDSPSLSKYATSPGGSLLPKVRLPDPNLEPNYSSKRKRKQPQSQTARHSKTGGHIPKKSRHYRSANTDHLPAASPPAPDIVQYPSLPDLVEHPPAKLDANVSFTSTVPTQGLSFGSSRPRDGTTTAATSFAETSFGVPKLQHITTGSPTKGSTNGSPRKMQHQVRNFPTGSLFVGDIPSGPRNFPLIFRWEYYRLALENGLQPEDISTSTCDPSLATEDGFWAWAKEHPSFPKLPPRGPKGLKSAWAAQEDNYKGFSLKMTLAFNSRNIGHLLVPSLEPIARDLSCRLQRVFGADRLLYVTLPDWRTPPTRLKEQKENIAKGLEEWLMAEHQFLGRTWRAFHVEAKKTKQPGKPLAESSFVHRVVLFAISGCDIPPKEMPREYSVKGYHTKKPTIFLHELLEWFLPFSRNKNSSFLKAYARLDLALSRTHETIVFEPHQVSFVRDKNPDDNMESTEYNDPRLKFLYPFDHGRVMNDGCSLISFATARLIWSRMGGTGPVPSVFQGRIGSAKGIWMLSGAPDSREPKDSQVSIDVSDSQNKFEREWNEEGFLTFELLRTSSFPGKAGLHSSFLPILVDRGVPRDRIIRLVKDYLDFQRAEVLELLEDPKALARSVYNETFVGDGSQRESGWPRSLHETVLFLLNAGFVPKNLPYLADQVQTLLSTRMIRGMKNFSLRVGRSVNVLGIADPKSVLKPGEIHMGFSKEFYDEISGESCVFLQNKAVLVARHPALRRSDIQKVRAVFKPELAHLKDVVIFPSTGKFPLAGKLQGGDYDGDTFWVCWDESLATDFRNAPAQMHDPNPEDYGIQVERAKLGEMIQGINPIAEADEYLRRSFQFRLEDSLLGQCTNFHENLAYYEGQIDSPGINALADIHDLLVDSAKNGYIFDRKAFNSFIQQNPDIRKKKPPEPAYKRAMKKIKEGGYQQFIKDLAAKSFPFKHGHINDFLFFTVVVPHMKQTLEITDDKLRRDDKVGVEPDVTLLEPYQKAKRESDTKIVEDLEHLDTQLDTLYRTWCTALGKKRRSDSNQSSNDRIRRAIRTCLPQYQAIAPKNPDCPRWQLSYVEGRISEWDLLKASALYSLLHRRKVFVWNMAGPALGYIKAVKTEGSQTIDWSILSAMKPGKSKKRSATRPGDYGNGDASGYESDEEWHVSDFGEALTDARETDYEDALEYIVPH